MSKIAWSVTNTSRGAIVNTHDKDDMSPLLLAASHGHVDTIKTLIKNNAEISDDDKNGKNVVYLAVEKNHLKAMQVNITILE